jgi:hypothetical protein
MRKADLAVERFSTETFWRKSAIQFPQRKPGIEAYQWIAAAGTGFAK